MSRPHIVLDAALAALLATLAPVPAHSEDAKGDSEFMTSISPSPRGEWLVVDTQQLQPIQNPGAPPGTRSFQAVGQWLHRVGLQEKDSASRLLYLREGEDVAEKGIGYEAASVLADGTVLAFRRQVLVRWDPAGKRTERKVGEVGDGFYHLSAHPEGKKAHFIFQPITESERRSKDLHFLIDPGSLRIEPVRALAGIERFDLHWTKDGNHVIGVDAVPGNPPRIQDPDGRTTYPNETYRLMRLDLKTGKRQVISDKTWIDGIRYGTNVMAWNYLGGAKRGVFRTATIAPPHDPKEVPALNAWEPVLSLGAERFLIRETEGNRHRIVDLAAFDPAKFESEARDIPFPKHESIHFSPALGRFILGTDHFTIVLAGEDGSVTETLKLDRQASPVKKGR